MSTTVLRSPRASAAAAALPVAAGLLILLARVQIISSGSGRNVAMAVAYCLLFAVGVAPPVLASRAAATLPPVVVTLAGVGAFGLVSVAWWQTHVVTPWAVGGLMLAIVAAIAEEAFFRRLMFDRLLPLGAAAAVVGSALVFALVHVPLYGTSVLWLDLGAGLLLSWQRLASGSWVAPAVTHSFANVLAVLR